MLYKIFGMLYLKFSQKEVFITFVEKFLIVFYKNYSEYQEFLRILEKKNINVFFYSIGQTDSRYLIKHILRIDES